MLIAGAPRDWLKARMDWLNAFIGMMTGIMLVRWAAESAPPGIMVLAAIHVLFAVCFGAVMFGSPKPRT